VITGFIAQSQTPPPKFKVIVTELSRGNVAGREFIEMVVAGTKTCSESAGGDSIAHLGNYVVYDPNGLKYYSDPNTGDSIAPGIASGKYRFPKNATWDSVPFGAIILIYNNNNKNSSITIKDDTLGRVTYVVPVNWLDSNFDGSIPPPDSILPSPSQLNLQNDNEVYLVKPIYPINSNLPPTYTNDPNNWVTKPVPIPPTPSNETPGSMTSSLVSWYRGFTQTAVQNFNVGLTFSPDTSVIICPYTNIYFAATSSLTPKDSSHFQWYVNSIPDSIIRIPQNDTIPNTTDSTVKTLHHNDTVTVRVTTGLKCVTGGVDTVYKTYIAFNVLPDVGAIKVFVKVDSSKALVDSLGVDTAGVRNMDTTWSYKTFCRGAKTKFTAFPNYVGPSDKYKWVYHGKVVSSDSTLKIDSLFIDKTTNSTNKDTLLCIQTTSFACVAPYDTTRIVITILDSLNPPGVVVTGDTALCSGFPVSYCAKLTPVSIGDSTAFYTFNWMINQDTIQPPMKYWDSTNKGGQSTYLGDSVYVDSCVSFTTKNLKDGDSLRVVLYTHKLNSCPIDTVTISNTLYMHVTTTVNPSVKITASQDGICPPPIVDIIVFTADTASVGINPIIQWGINSVDIPGANQITFTNAGYPLKEGDTVYVYVRDTSDKCRDPDTARAFKVMNYGTFNPSFKVSSLPPPPFCEGVVGPVKYTAQLTGNYGANPSCQWFLNGIDTTKYNDSLHFTYLQIKDKDTITFKLTSSVACATPKDTSDVIVIDIKPNVIPTVKIDTAITACLGTSVCITPVYTGGGTNPTFDWYKLPGNIPLAINIPSPYCPDLTQFQTGDFIYCVINSKAQCVVSPGTANSDTMRLTINLPPAIGNISGSPTVCVGATNQLAVGLPGGTWSPNSNPIATVNNFGTVTGISDGNVTISYSLTDQTTKCTATAQFPLTVLPTNIPPDVFQNNICIGEQISITNSIGTNYFYRGWGTSDKLIAIVDNNGNVTGIDNGTAVIYDTIVNDCGTTVLKDTILVGRPKVGSISGSTSICTLNNTIKLSNTSQTGYWFNKDTTISRIDSLLGIDTAKGFGVDIIYFVATNRCGNDTSTGFLVTVGKPVVGNISGGRDTICVSSTLSLSNITKGGTWISSNTSFATVDPNSGLVTGIAIGNATITYSVTNTCGTSSATFKVYVTNPRTVFPPITSSDTIVCIQQTLPLLHPISGGKWTSQSTSIASVDSVTGVVTGLDNGTDTIVYTVFYNGCGTNIAKYEVIVGKPIVGSFVYEKNPICVGDITKVTNTSRGGTQYLWYTFNPAICTFSSASTLNTSIVGVGAGRAQILYQVFNKCAKPPFSGVSIVDSSLVIKALPVVDIITSIDSVVCLGGSLVYSSLTSGGTWSSSNPAVATVDPSGKVQSVSVGVAIITYTVVNSNNCSASVSKSFTVNAYPIVSSITGNNSFCYGRYDTLSVITPGGIWSSSNKSVTDSIKTVTAVGGASQIILRGYSATLGNSNITYTVTQKGCSKSDTFKVVVNPIPSIGTITSPQNTVCPNKNTIFNNSLSGGVWTSDSLNIAIIDATTGVVTGKTQGVDSIRYTVVQNGCDTSVASVVFVKQAPSAAPITSVDDFKVNIGLTISLQDATPGGTWSINPGNKFFSISSNVVQGLNAGIDTVKYQVIDPITLCDAFATALVTVLPKKYDVFIPNFLAPSSTNTSNQTFKVFSRFVTSVELKVFSQWGELMYQSTYKDYKIEKGWDGTFKGTKQPSGVYVYVATLTLENGTVEVKKGSVNLIR